MKKNTYCNIAIALVCVVGLGLGGFLLARDRAGYYDLHSPVDRQLVHHFEEAQVLKGSLIGRFRPDAALSAREFADWVEALSRSRGVGNRVPKESRDELSLDGAAAILGEVYGEKAPSLAESKAFFLRHGVELASESGLSRRQGLQLLRHMDGRLGHPDVIVYGSELESVAAAVAASSDGLEVLLLHENPDIGGLLVDGKLNYLDIPMSDGQWLLQGFAKDFYNEVGNSFEFETARQWMGDRLKAAGVEVHAVHGPLKVEMDGSRLKAVGDADKRYPTRYAIDASLNGDLMAAAGASYSKGLESLGRKVYPGASLIYELAGVDFAKVSEALQERAKEGDPTVGATPEVAWGFQEEMAGYKPSQDGLLVRGLGIAHLKESDRVVINHLIDTDIDPLSPVSVAASKMRMEKELRQLVPYLRAHLPGFEAATLYSVAPELYLRDSRHFQGSYVLSLADCLTRKPFKDRVLITNYPFDLHAAKDLKKNLVLYYGQSYNIPYRVLHDDEHPNLLVAGKCASFDPLAASSARIVMTGTMLGEIAGHAVGLLAPQNADVQDLLVPDLRQILHQHGFLMRHPAPLKAPVPKRLIELLSDGKTDLKDAQAALAKETGEESPAEGSALA